jgi:hypothetical protein
MFLIVKNTWEQYISWLGMQFILVPIIAPIVFTITEKVQNYINKNKYEVSPIPKP